MKRKLLAASLSLLLLPAICFCQKTAKYISDGPLKNANIQTDDPLKNTDPGIAHPAAYEASVPLEWISAVNDSLHLALGNILSKFPGASRQVYADGINADEKNLRGTGLMEYRIARIKFLLQYLRY